MAIVRLAAGMRQEDPMVGSEPAIPRFRNAEAIVFAILAKSRQERLVRVCFCFFEVRETARCLTLLSAT